MMSGSTSFSSDVNETTRLKREVSVLQEELSQCKADKDFVWSLWKRLQVANPDITQAIGLVLQREKEKWDAREKKLIETVCHREGRIDELERRAAKQSEEITELISSKLQQQKHDEVMRAELQNARLQYEAQQREIAALQCKNADSAVREAIRELDQLNLELKQQLAGRDAECEKLRRSLDDVEILKDSQKRRLTNLEEDFKSLENKNVELLKENHQLQMLLRHSEDDAKSQKNGIDVKSAELESLRRELSDLWQTHRQTTEHCTQQTQLIKQLQTLHTETQTVLHNQEEAFAVELAAQQCRVHDQEQVIAELHKTLQRLKSESDGQNASQSDSAQDGGDCVESRIRTMEQELLTLRARVQSPRRTSFRVCETVDRALSPIRASARQARPLRRSRSESNRERFHASSDGDEPNVLRRKLENVEQRMEEMRETVEAKDKELEMVRTAHSRRLDRLRSVMTSYGLIKKQLQLYEDDFLYAKKKKNKKPSVSIKLVPDPRATVKQLQKEDADAVWNELAHFRKENKVLKTENFKLAEDCDELRVKVASDVSSLHQLRCCIQEQNEEIKILRDQLDEIGRQADADVRHQTDIAQAQLDKACHEIGSLREELHQLRLEKDELIADKRMLSEDILSLQDRNSRQRVEICNFKTDILRFQRKLRKKPVHASHSKPTAYKQVAHTERTQNKSARMSENQNDFWEEIFQDDDVDQLTVSQVSSTSATSCSLGEAIANEARSRGATQDGVATTDGCGKPVLQQRERTSTPTSDSSTGLNKQQRQLIKAYMLGLTKSLGIGQSAQPVATSQQYSSPAVAEDGSQHTATAQKTATTTTTSFSTSASRTIATLRQRVNGLQRHLGVLRLAKEAALKTNAEQKKENDSLMEQLATANQKQASSKQQIQRLMSEVEKLRAEKDLLETKMAEYSFDTSICSTAAKAEQELISSLQSRLKTSSAAVSRQLEQIKQLRSENEKQAEKISQQTERISHLERDLAQKRILMDDIKLKLTIAQENAESDADIMLEVEAKLKNLAENNGRLKSQIDCLKTRLDCVGREKYQIELVVSKLTDEIDRKTKLVSDLQKKCCELQSRLMDIEQSAQNHLRQLASHTEMAIDTAQARLTFADTRLKEYAKFIKVFAFTLLSSIKQCRSALSKRRSVAGGGGDIDSNATTAVKMTSIIRDVTTDFSQSSLTDLLNAPTSHADHVVQLDAVGADVSELDTRWAKRCESLLQSQAGFSLGLVDLFIEKVEERCNLSVQLNVSSSST